MSGNVENQPTRKFNLPKKVAIVAGIVAVLVLASLVITPLVVDVDKFRPQIVQIANENINGKLTIEKMALSLWGQIEIKIDGIHVLDASGQELVSVKETYAQISFLSFLKGSPHLVFRVQKPNATIVKNKHGKLNILSLIKETSPTATSPEAKSAETKTEVPGIAILAAAGVDLELIDANLTFKDLTSGFSQNVEGFNLIVQDISMSRPMNLKVWADISTKIANTLSFHGPFTLTGVISPKFEGAEFKHAAVDLDLNVNDLAIDVATAFNKPKGIPANLKTTMNVAKDAVDIEKAIINFHNASFTTSVKLRNLQSVSPVVDFKLVSNPIDLSKWDVLVPALKGFDLDGRLDISANASGPTNKLGYEAHIGIQDFNATTPGLLAKPKIQMNVDIVTDQIKKLAVNVDAPGTDLAVLASLKSFSAPQLKMEVTSKGIDLDQILPPAKEEKAKPTKDGQGKAGEQTAQTQSAIDVDGSLEPLRTNELIKSIAADIKVRIAHFKGFKVDAQKIAMDFKLKNLAAAIEKFSADVWQGNVGAKFQIDLKPKSPAYNMNLNVARIDLKSAVESQMDSLRNTMVGRLSFSANGRGQSLNSDKLIKNLNLKGNFKITDAVFASIDVGRMVTDGVNEGMKGTTDKIPGLKDKKLTAPNNFSAKYTEVSSDFTLKDGVFLAPNFKTVSKDKNGIDLQGRTEADLVRDKLSAKWLVIDTHNVTKAKDVSVDYQGLKINQILAEKKKPVSFPVVLGCKLSAPCYDYKSVPEHFGKIAMANSKGAIGDRAKDELKKHQKEATKKAEDEVKKRAKKELEKRGQKDLIDKLGL